MRVFVGSTVYDLLDVRAELYEFLRELGAEPIMSDNDLTDFRVEPDKNSIETCLINLAKCDQVVFVFDKRYGPSLKKAGYDDISATHLEYRHAAKHRLPIHFYARDRLEADYSIWKKNKRANDIEFLWIEKNNERLFEILDEHCRLSKDSDFSNWYTTFRTSVDIKSSLRTRLRLSLLESQVIQAIQENKFALFDVHVEVDPEFTYSDHCRIASVKAYIQNVGGAPAFNFRMGWAKNDDPSTISEGLSGADGVDSRFFSPAIAHHFRTVAGTG